MVLKMIEKYESLVTRRTESLFKKEYEKNASKLFDSYQGRRVAVIGAAGSIGSAAVKCLSGFKPSTLTLFDISENNLVELTRDLRSTAGLQFPKEFAALPIGLGSCEFERYFAKEKPFDYCFNFSALKHVRSEKDIYCIMRMFDTNVLFLNDFLENIPYRFKKFFSVSSDKAANPASVMGASKSIMEKVLLSYSPNQPFVSARFANVAFSDGSLPHGFLRRIDKKQPLSAPNDVKRYFISHEEAGQLCVLACCLGQNKEIFFPKLTQKIDEHKFSEIAIKLLEYKGYEPLICASEEEAKNSFKFIEQGKWPCFFFPADTSGEKGFEEFCLESENVDFKRFNKIGVITKERNDSEAGILRNFISFLREAKNKNCLSKDDYIFEIKKLLPDFGHIETNKSLDQKM